MGNIQNFGPLKFSLALDPLNLGFAVLKGSVKIQLEPLIFLSPCYVPCDTGQVQVCIIKYGFTSSLTLEHV